MKWTEENYNNGDMVTILAAGNKHYRIISFDEKSQTVKAKREINFYKLEEKEVTFNLLDKNICVIPF